METEIKELLQRMITVEKIKASMETFKAYQIYYQTLILSKRKHIVQDKTFATLKRHTDLIVECAEKVKGV